MGFYKGFVKVINKIKIFVAVSIVVGFITALVSRIIPGTVIANRDYVSLHDLNKVILIIVLIFMVSGVATSIIVGIVEHQRINKLAEEIEKKTNTENRDSNDYKYIQSTFTKLYGEMENAKRELEETLYVKLLSIGLTETEWDIISEDVKTPCYMLYLHNHSLRKGSILQSIEFYLKKNNVNIYNITEVSEKTLVLFLEYKNGLAEIVNNIPTSLNKDHNLDLRGLIAELSNIEDATEVYSKMKGAIRYIEYGTVKSIDEIDTASDEKELEKLVANCVDLAQLLRDNNMFEAKRFVYEQWYKISDGAYGANGIERLFYSQISVISQVCAEKGIKCKIPEFNTNKDVVSVAFEITECIGKLCGENKDD